jgi:sulfite reductase beta subunit-like hemoprotein
MYQYDDLDQAFVDARVAEFRDQTRRHLAGGSPRTTSSPCACAMVCISAACADAAYRYPLRTPEGAPAAQARRHHHRYDRGYGHSLRASLQLNWPKLEDVPEILAELATVQCAIQTSGNCVRNVTADHFAGIAPMRSTTRAWGSSPVGACRVHLPAAGSDRRLRRCADRATPRSRRGPAPGARCRGCLGFRVLVGGASGTHR